MYFTVKPFHFVFYIFLLQLLYGHARDGTQLGQMQFCPILEFKLVLHATSKTTHFFSLNVFVFVYIICRSFLSVLFSLLTPLSKTTFLFHLIF